MAKQKSDPLEILKRQAKIQAITDLLNAGVGIGYLDEIEELLKTNVDKGSTLATLMDELRTFTVQGRRLERYTKQVASDALHTFAREYQEAVSENLGIEFYKYSGNVIRDTRPFCIERVNKYYHKKEIQSWASLSWDGKVKGTTKQTIFKWLGGWNCRHQLVGVNTLLVPREVIERNIASGNFKPDKEVKEHFNL